MKQQTAPQGVTEVPSTVPSAKTRRRSAAVKLGAEIGIEDAAGLHKTLAQHVALPDAVSFDAADVQRIHTAALQLFCLFCSDRRTAGRETRWLKPSAALRSAAALLGATTLLSLGKA